MIVGSPTKLSLIPSGVMPVVYVNQGDAGYDKEFLIYNGDSPYNVPAGVSATIRGKKADGYGVTEAAALTEGSNLVTVTITEQMVAAEGPNLYELVFVDTDGLRIATINMVWAVKADALGDAVISDSDLDYATQVMDQLQSVSAFKNQLDTNTSGLAAETAARIAADATLQSNINTEASTRAAADQNLQAQISQIVAPSGEAPSAAEVQNARIGADGVTYQTLGEAIRANDTGLKSQIDNANELFSDGSTLLSGSLTDKTSTSSGVSYTLTGNTITASGTATAQSLFSVLGTTTSSPPSWMIGGKKYILHLENGTLAEIVLQAKTTSNTSLYSFATFTQSGDYIVEIPEDITVFRLAVRAASGTIVNGSITLEMSNAVELKELFSLSSDNAITIPDNSDFNDYTTPGTYKITNNVHASTMTNMPLQMAGKLIVNSLSQPLRLVQWYFGVATAAPIWLRYYDGTDWTNWDNLAKQSVLSSVSDRVSILEQAANINKVIYESGSFASGKATESIIIYLPASTGFIAYHMYHFIDNDNNCNGWQIYHAYHVNSNLSDQIDLTVTGEWECAIRLNGRDDFSGGHTHGDEIMSNMTFILDGVPTDYTSLTSATDFTELRIIQTSVMYDPDDHTTQIANHGKEYVFTNGKLTINQSLKWLVAETLANCFMAMFLPLKTKIDRASANSDFEVLTLATDTSEPLTSITKYNANAVAMWDTSSGFSANVSVPVYPTGLTDGDRISISDNSGNDYNKLYFKVCGGGSSTVGELWKSTTIYELNYK